jgi:membrane associated rhomboid family serine protease
MIPVRDVIPSRTTPGITLLLIALNAIAFGVMLTAGRPASSVPWLGAALSLVQHGGLVHLAANLGALWLFGENVEDRFGHLRFLLGYVGLGYAAALTELWLAPQAATADGAAGAISGIVAAYLVMFPRSRVLTLVPVRVPPALIELPAAGLAAAWFLLQVARGTGPLTLFVGAAAGVVAVWLLGRPERRRVEWWAE